MFSNDQALISNALPISFSIPKEWKDAIDPIELIYKRISNSVNGKESALYSLAEQSTFQLYFKQGDPQNFRNVFRKTFDIVNLNGGNIAAGATVSFVHNIVGLKEAALIFGEATNTINERFSFMYPYVKLNDTNVIVTNPDVANPLTQCYVVANYLKT